MLVLIDIMGKLQHFIWTGTLLIKYTVNLFYRWLITKPSWLYCNFKIFGSHFLSKISVGYKLFFFSISRQLALVHILITYQFSMFAAAGYNLFSYACMQNNHQATILGCQFSHRSLMVIHLSTEWFRFRLNYFLRH